MKNDLVAAIRKQTEDLFANAEIMLMTCDPDFTLCGMPIWKHAYHALHSCDQWYINPSRYTEPDFHTPGLNSLDELSESILTREQLLAYHANVRRKILAYLDSLTDAMLYDVPPGCLENRLALILGQFRHLYAHLGNVNATTIIQTGQWPRVIGLRKGNAGDEQRLYE